MKKIKIQKSVKLLIAFSIALLITLVVIDNNYYANNKDKVAKNRENLRFTQISTISVMSWVNNMDIKENQLMEIGIIVDSAKTKKDTIKIK
ncbi:MAG TPA: hypothetical protein DD434_14105 [Bacteroidales bacterium]|nr:hypothetical protein [Bacteroidales bacterium]